MADRPLRLTRTATLNVGYRLETTDQHILPVRFLHFYGNYRVYQSRTDRPYPPRLGYRIHRNLEGIEVWGDGANVREAGQPPPQAGDTMAFDVHHFGEVRHPARLRQKWRTQARQHRTGNARWDMVPGFVYDLRPHRWDDPEILPHLRLYDGPYIRAVVQDPSEFVRDDLWLCERLMRVEETEKGASS